MTDQPQSSQLAKAMATERVTRSKMARLEPEPGQFDPESDLDSDSDRSHMCAGNSGRIQQPNVYVLPNLNKVKMEVDYNPIIAVKEEEVEVEVNDSMDGGKNPELKIPGNREKRKKASPAIPTPDPANVNANDHPGDGARSFNPAPSFQTSSSLSKRWMKTDGHGQTGKERKYKLNLDVILIKENGYRIVREVDFVEVEDRPDGRWFGIHYKSTYIPETIAQIIGPKQLEEYRKRDSVKTLVETFRQKATENKRRDE